MNEKQQQLLFDKGITNVPSDALCSDNALSYCHGMVYDNGEHKVIQEPAEHITGYTGIERIPYIIYIHKTIQDIYIGYVTRNHMNQIVYGEKNGNHYVQLGTVNNFYYTNSTKITSVGKTLIISDSEGMHYFLWDADLNSYKSLGDKIPEPHFKFWLEGGTEYYVPDVLDSDWYEHNFGFGGDVELKYTATNVGPTNGIIADRESTGAWINTDSDDKYNDLVVGLYSKNKKAICEKKAFCEPFYIRYALRLYDDSIYYISNPILMFPSVTRNTYFWYDHRNERIVCFTKFSYLHYQMTLDEGKSLEDFSDIVKDIDIFVSDGINIYDTLVQQPLYYPKTSDPSYQYPTGLFDGVYHNYIVSPHDGNSKFRSQDLSKAASRISFPAPTQTDDFLIAQRLDCLQIKDRDELTNSFKEQSIFYKICSVGLRPSTANLNSKIETHTLENLTTQEQIGADDYFSRCKLYPDNIFTYNSRINLANVSRGFFEGYDFFMPFVINSNTGDTYDFYVTIKTDQRTITVKHTKATTDHIQGIYFFYPDSRANHVTIMKGNTCILNEDLEEHGSLNGAFYFRGLPDNIAQEPITTAPTPPTPNNNANEQLPNYILQSEVNDPWVFNAEGYFKVGTGKIIGMSTITQALSEGQFGQYPLLVFSESGIWALSVASTGYYSAVHPMSREVCNNAESITQTDGAVFFTSEKGLMMIVGESVKCVSEQMNGKEDTFPHDYVGLSQYDFKTVLSHGGRIAYDYRDSLLWILGNAPVGYVYSIKNGTFSTVSCSQDANVINNYPDTLIQASTTEIYSLLNRVDINDDAETYFGDIVTRPMKLENALALKSILKIRNIYDMDGSIGLRIFASNNLNNWVELHSLRGTPWKYYRFAYQFENMSATDRFSGAVLITQERRTNKLR